MGQRGGQGRAAGWLVAMVMMVTSLTGCGQGAPVAPSDATVTGRVDVPWGASDAGSDAAADATDVSTRFPCPEGWVASEHGGCGPDLFGPAFVAVGAALRARWRGHGGGLRGE